MHWNLIICILSDAYGLLNAQNDDSFMLHEITGPTHPSLVDKEVLHTRASHSCENFAYHTREECVNPMLYHTGAYNTYYIIPDISHVL